MTVLAMLLPICPASFSIAGDLAWGHALRHLIDLRACPGLEPDGGLPPHAQHRCLDWWPVTGDR